MPFAILKFICSRFFAIVIIMQWVNMNARWFLNNFSGSTIFLAVPLPVSAHIVLFLNRITAAAAIAKDRKSFRLPFNFLISFVWSNIKLIFDPTHFLFTSQRNIWKSRVATNNLFRRGPKKRIKWESVVENVSGRVGKAIALNGMMFFLYFFWFVSFE